MRVHYSGVVWVTLTAVVRYDGEYCCVLQRCFCVGIMHDVRDESKFFEELDSSGIDQPLALETDTLPFLGQQAAIPE